MYELAANYLVPALGVVGLGVSFLLGWVLFDRIADGKVKRILMRLEAALGAAIVAAAEAWATAIKKGLEDGTLTGAEKDAAKRAALDVVKGYMGVKGIQTLLKVLGFNENALDDWIGNKVLGEAIRSGLIPPGGVTGLAITKAEDASKSLPSPV